MEWVYWLVGIIEGYWHEQGYKLRKIVLVYPKDSFELLGEEMKVAQVIEIPSNWELTEGEGRKGEKFDEVFVSCVVFVFLFFFLFDLHFWTKSKRKNYMSKPEQ
jgi:hypothetical protein